MNRLKLENERLVSDLQQQKQEVDFKVKELDKVVNNYFIVVLFIYQNINIRNVKIV